MLLSTLVLLSVLEKYKIISHFLAECPLVQQSWYVTLRFWNLWLFPLCENLWLFPLCENLWLFPLCENLWLFPLCENLCFFPLCENLCFFPLCENLWLFLRCENLWLFPRCENLWLNMRFWVLYWFLWLFCFKCAFPLKLFSL